MVQLSGAALVSWHNCIAACKADLVSPTEVCAACARSGDGMLKVFWCKQDLMLAFECSYDLYQVLLLTCVRGPEHMAMQLSHVLML